MPWLIPSSPTSQLSRKRKYRGDKARSQDNTMDESLNYTQLTYTLNNGAKMPAIGFGTGHALPSTIGNAVKVALKSGYRHVDTSMSYLHDKEVGQAIRDSGVPREDLWITTKLDSKWHHRVEAGLDASLESLGLDYVDMFLMEWPCAIDPDEPSKALKNWDFIDTWLEMMKLPATGKVRTIGVCNMHLTNLKILMNHPACTIKPAVNQIEVNPNHPANKLLDYCMCNGIHVTAYSCLGSTDSFLLAGKSATLNRISKSKRKSRAQVLLMWGILRGTSVIPRSITPSRIRSNFDLNGWELDLDEMADLSGVKERFKVIDDSFLPERVFFDDEDVTYT